MGMGKQKEDEKRKQKTDKKQKQKQDNHSFEFLFQGWLLGKPKLIKEFNKGKQKYCRVA